jgi:hypothetical protein
MISLFLEGFWVERSDATADSFQYYGVTSLDHDKLLQDSSAVTPETPG